MCVHYEKHLIHLMPNSHKVLSFHLKFINSNHHIWQYIFILYLFPSYLLLFDNVVSKQEGEIPKSIHVLGFTRKNGRDRKMLYSLLFLLVRVQSDFLLINHSNKNPKLLSPSYVSRWISNIIYSTQNHFRTLKSQNPFITSYNFEIDEFFAGRVNISWITQKLYQKIAYMNFHFQKKRIWCDHLRKIFMLANFRSRWISSSSIANPQKWTDGKSLDRTNTGLKLGTWTKMIKRYDHLRTETIK